MFIQEDIEMRSFWFHPLGYDYISRESTFMENPAFALVPGLILKSACVSVRPSVSSMNANIPASRGSSGVSLRWNRQPELDSVVEQKTPFLPVRIHILL